MIDFAAGRDVVDVTGDVLAVPVFSDLTWGPGADWVAEQSGDWLESYLGGQGFSGGSGQIAMVPGLSLDGFGTVAFVGLGDEIDAEGLRRAAGTAGRALAKYPRIVTTLHQVEIEDAVELVGLGVRLGQYRFDRYLSEPEPAVTVEVVFAGTEPEAIAQASLRAGVLADAVTLARDLVNEPAGSTPPAILAKRVVDEVAGLPIDVTVYDEDQIAAERFGGLAGVAQGSTNPPRMVVLEYAPEDAVASLAIVGKGIIFDSGGLSIKTATGMRTMKTDMAGAAAVYGTLIAAARLEIPLRIVGITPLTENMSGGRALRPGDVLTARNGKTIEVLNTDAEGRLVLADGLSLASEADHDLVVDIATLTGGCHLALGHDIACLFANDEDAAAAVESAAERAGEEVWRLPLHQEYRSKIDSSIADMRNHDTDTYGGVIAAALILQEFVGDAKWVHLDIAGPGRARKTEHYLVKGGSGFGVRTLVQLAEDMSTT